MSSGGEAEQQIARVRSALEEAENVAWRNIDFPLMHRPAVSHLATNITIGDFVPSQRIYHPNIRLEILELAQREQQRRMEKGSVFWYDPESRMLVVSTKAFGLSERMLKRFAWNHAARDISTRAQIMEPPYPSTLNQRVAQMLDLSFEADQRPAVEETTVVKEGFIKKLLAGEYFVTNLLVADPDIEYVNEVYPTALEIITEQVMIKHGQIPTFEQLIQQFGLFYLPGFEPHFSFAKALFQAMRSIDWRDILDAFKTGEVEDTIAFLERKAKGPNMGLSLYLNLVQAMKQDENELRRINRNQ